MSHSIIEIQLNSDGSGEYSYRLNYLLSNKKLCAQLLAAFPKALENKEAIEMVSVSESNQFSYPEEAIVLVFKGSPSLSLYKQYKITVREVYDLMDYYVIKYFPKSKKSILKIYDKSYYRHLLPALPSNIMLANQFGVGIHYTSDFNDTRLPNYRDIYFFCKSNVRNDVLSFYQKDIPEEPISNNLYLFGLTYLLPNTSEQIKICNLKRYVYPNDVNIKYPEKL